jgi:PAS domain-containing protein
MIDILVPYFKTGLENNEFCMWVTSQPLGVEDAKEALKKAVHDIDVYLEKGQLEITPYFHWYTKEGTFDSAKVLNGWVEKLNMALANGYDGLRLTGNTFWLEKEDWNDFVDYEKEVDRVIGNYHMIALCTYNLDRCNAAKIIDVAVDHQFALIKKQGKWEQIESSKRKEAEKTAILQSLSLRENQAKLETALASMNEAVFISDTEGNFIDFNDAFATFYKFKNKDEGFKIFAEYPDILYVFMADGTPAPVDMWAVPRALRGEKATDAEYTLRRKDTGETWIGSYSFAPIRDNDGVIFGLVVIARDITERKRAEQEHEMTVEFLHVMNKSKGTVELVHSAVNFFRERSGFEAVGIRLKDGDDYPYFETYGFSKEFVRMENSLCVKDAAEQLIHDSDGYPIHKCMCGNVICGRFDPSKSFFTTRGSFCTNCTTELLATTTDADLQARTCNICNGEGYESVALIALCVGEERPGLLQLNDRRKGQFSLETISMWERLADYLAVALAKAQAEESLQKAHGNLRCNPRICKLSPKKSRGKMKSCRLSPRNSKCKTKSCRLSPRNSKYKTKSCRLSLRNSKYKTKSCRLSLRNSM